MSRISFAVVVATSFVGLLTVSASIQAAPILLQAGTIVQPTDAAFSVANFGTAVPTRGIDGSGLSSPLITGAAVPVVYPSHGNVGHPADASLTNNITTFSMTYDLGAIYTLNQDAGFHLWNYNESLGGNGRGIRIASLFYTDDGTNIGNATNWVQATTNSTFSIAPGVNTYTGDDYTYLNNLTARFVRFDVTANWSNVSPAGAFTGISEIRFVTADIFAPSIPEPSTLALVGMAGVGLVATRRSRRSRG